MTSEARFGTTTILFTDLVNSTELLQRAGDEQGARPLRAIVDYNEALMYIRRGEPGDRERAARLLKAALSQFREIAMTGWITRAEELPHSIAEGTNAG